MGKKVKCSKCGKEHEVSKKARFERGAMITALRAIKISGMKEKNEEIKDCCDECWKLEMRSFMKPYAQALGQNAEEW